MKYQGLALFSAVTCPVFAAPIPALPDNVEEAFKSYIGLPGLLVPIMQKAQDKTSADAAAEPLHKSLPAVYEAREKLHRMPRLTPEQTQQIRQKYALQMRKEWGRMYEEISRLQKERCYQSAALAEVFHLLCMMIEK